MIPKRVVHNPASWFFPSHLVCVCIAFSFIVFAFSFFFFYFLIENSVFTWDAICQWVLCTVHETHYLFDCPNFSLQCGCSVGPMHCSRDLQTSFFTKTFIKNRFHSTIHTFKNDFATVFLVFNLSGK